MSTDKYRSETVRGIGEIIHKIRRDLGLNQQQFIQRFRLDIEQTTLSQIERGKIGQNLHSVLIALESSPETIERLRAALATQYLSGDEAVLLDAYRRINSGTQRATVIKMVDSLSEETDAEPAPISTVRRKTAG